MGKLKINGELDINSYLTSATTMYLETPSSKSIIFKQGGVARARFNPNGCFNIGSDQASDTYSLYVVGDSYFNDTAHIKGIISNKIEINNSNTDGGLYIRRLSSDNESLRIYNVDDHTTFLSTNETAQGKIYFTLKNLATSNPNEKTITFIGNSSGTEIQADKFTGTAERVKISDGKSDVFRSIVVDNGSSTGQNLYTIPAIKANYTTGVLQANGVQIGNNSITLNEAIFDTNVTPNTTNTYSLGTTDQYWKYIKSSVIDGNLISGQAYTSGDGTGYFKVLSLTKPLNTSVNTALSVLFSGYYSDAANGLAVIQARWTSGKTTPDRCNLRWLLHDSGFNKDNFILTYAYDETAQECSINLYIYLSGSWKSVNATKLSESEWGSGVNKFKWSFHNGSGDSSNYKFTEIPTNEIRVESIVMTKLSNQIDAANITSGILPFERIDTIPVSKGGTGKTSFTSGYLVLGNGDSALKESDAHINYSEGTTSKVGYETLILGNEIAKGTAKNAYGKLGLYSQKKAGIYLVAADCDKWEHTNTLPASSGVLINSAGGTMNGELKLSKTGTISNDSGNYLLAYNNSDAAGATEGTCLGYQKNITTLRGSELKWYDGNANKTTYKILTEKDISQIEDDILGGAGPAYDTLKELGDLIDSKVGQDVFEALGELIANREIKAGAGLEGGGKLATDITLSHAATSSVLDVSAVKNTYISGLTFDDFGHVTGVSTASDFLPLDGGTLSNKAVIQFAPSAGTIENTGMSITYGKIATQGNLILNADIDTSGNQYVLITASKGLSTSAEDGLKITSTDLTWKKNTVVDKSNCHNILYGVGKSISAGETLNDYRTPGKFYCGSSSTSSQILDGPSGSIGFTDNYALFVMSRTSTSSESSLGQILMTAGSRMFIRNCPSSGTWGSWYEFLTTKSGATIVSSMPDIADLTAGSYGPSENATPAFEGTFNVPYITVDTKGLVTAISTKTVKIPKQTNVSIGTAKTENSTLNFGDTFTSITSLSASSHKVTPTVTTYTLPSMPTLSKGTDATAEATLNHSDTFTAITGFAIDGHTITPTVTTYTLPADKNTDTKVTQTVRTTNGEFPILLRGTSAGTATTTTTTTFAKAITVNPSTGFATMSGLRLNGSNNYSTKLQSAVTSATNTLTLPTVNGELLATTNGGYLHSRTYIVTHPEDSEGSILPFVTNSLAFCLKKGSTLSVTVNGVEKTVEDKWNRSFDGTTSYMGFSDSDKFITATTDIVVINLTLHKTFKYGNTFYLDFGRDWWAPKNIKVEYLGQNETTWHEAINVVDHPLGYIKTPQLLTGENGINKIRITITNFHTTAFRIAAIGLINYGSLGFGDTYISQGGCDNIVGDLTPYSHLTYDLGSEQQMWNKVWATIGVPYFGQGTYNLNDYKNTMAISAYYFGGSTTKENLPAGLPTNSKTFLLSLPKTSVGGAYQLLLQDNAMFVRYSNTDTSWRRFVTINANTAKGNSSTPIYIDVNGIPQNCTEIWNKTNMKAVTSLPNSGNDGDIVFLY